MCDCEKLKHFMASNLIGAGRIPFAFLEDTHQRFVKTHGPAIHRASAYVVNDEFSRVLSQQIKYYSNTPNADRIYRGKGEMSKVRLIMPENIDKVVDRGESLEAMVDRIGIMQGNTLHRRRQARRFRTTVWWRNCSTMFKLLMVLIFILSVMHAFDYHVALLSSRL